MPERLKWHFGWHVLLYGPAKMGFEERLIIKIFLLNFLINRKQRWMRLNYLVAIGVRFFKTYFAEGSVK